MDEDRTESFESPLEALLADGPEVEPPTDLKARCLRTVRETGKPYRRAVWPLVLKGAAGLAAAFVVLMALTSLLSRPGERTREQVAALPETPPSPAARAAGELREAPSDDALALHSTYVEPEGEALRALEYDLTDNVGDAVDVRRRAARAYDAMPRARGAMMSGGTGADDPYACAAPTLGRPWRDESDERRKIARRELTLEAGDVAETYERAKPIIASVKGWVESEELRISKYGDSVAMLHARVPILALDGVLAQLQDLGRVVLFRGGADDKTREFYARGADIRKLAEQELALVPQYEAEQNARRKASLLARIRAIRAQIESSKRPLQGLADQTAYASIYLTIREAMGPQQFLARMTDSAPNAAAWVAVSAVFWVPVLLVGLLVARRLRARRRP